MSNQGNVQASVRTRSGVTAELDWNGDWHYLWDQEGIADGTFNERMLTWINTELGETYTNLPGAMQAYAESLGFYNWSSMTAIDPGVFDPTSLFGNGEAGAVYDFSNVDTLFQERTGASATTPSGQADPIGTVVDLSGNDNYLVAPSDDARPVRDVLSDLVFAGFDLANDALASSFALEQPVVIVAGLARLSQNSFQVAIDGYSTSDAYVYSSSANELSIYAGVNIIGPVATTEGQNFVLTARFDGASSRIAKNADAYQTGDAGANDPNGITIGGEADGSGGLAGSKARLRLYRLIVIGRDLTDDEISDARAWCAEAAGVTL